MKLNQRLRLGLVLVTSGLLMLIANGPWRYAVAAWMLFLGVAWVVIGVAEMRMRSEWPVGTTMPPRMQRRLEAVLEKETDAPPA